MSGRKTPGEVVAYCYLYRRQGRAERFAEVVLEALAAEGYQIVDKPPPAAEAFHLFDGDTADDLGEATPMQIAASYADEPSGMFLIDKDGDPVAPDTYDADLPGVRKVYVEKVGP